MANDGGQLPDDSGAVSAAPLAGPPARKPRRSRFVSGIPRRRKGAPEPWAVQALRGLATVGVAFVCMLAGFLVGVGLAELTGVVEILMIPAIGGIAAGMLFAQRVANWIMDRIA